MMNATCGAKCYEQFKKLNRDSSSLKMYLVSRILMADWYSSKCALTWKMKGTKFSRLLFQLVPKTLRTEETDAGLLLPTPTAMMDEAPIEKVDARNQKQMEKGNSPFILGLGQQAMRGMLPTPIYPRETDLKHYVSQQIGKTSQLNPRFVAEMMGFPPNWTELPFQNGEQNQSRATETP
jgi:hypothetical protein